MVQALSLSLLFFVIEPAYSAKRRIRNRVHLRKASVSTERIIIAESLVTISFAEGALAGLRERSGLKNSSGLSDVCRVSAP